MRQYKSDLQLILISRVWFVPRSGLKGRIILKENFFTCLIFVKCD